MPAGGTGGVGGAAVLLAGTCFLTGEVTEITFDRAYTWADFMKAEEKYPAAGDGGQAAEEPLFTEEAEEEARPVVPLGRLDNGGPASRRTRGRLPRSFVLVLALIAAGAAGATAGLLAHIGRAPQPAVEATPNVAPEPDTPQTAVSNVKETSPAEQSDAHARSETRAEVEVERPQVNLEALKVSKVGMRERGAEERARRTREEVEIRREDEDATAARRREGDEERAVRRDEDKDGKPKARLVGIITRRQRP